ncbi:MAG: acyl-CoA dehydrogenase family protein, partial [Solirubrobacterales bacterium]
MSAPIIRDSGLRNPLPPFGEEHEALRKTVARFVADEIAPSNDEWEDAGAFPDSLFTRCGELGFLGLKYPEELGGQGGDHVHDAVWA